MAAFDAELRASIRELQSTVTALSTETEKTNATLRQMQQEVRGVGMAHREAGEAVVEHTRNVEKLEGSIHGVGAGLRLMGGEAREAGHLLHGLFAFNPLALAAGVAIGFVVDKVQQLVEGAIKGKEKVDDLGKSFEQMQAKAAEVQTAGLLKLDPQALRARAFDRYFTGGSKGEQDIPDAIRSEVEAGANDAVLSGRVKDRSEGIDRIRKAGLLRPRGSGAFGPVAPITRSQFGAAAAGIDDPDAFADALQRSQGTEDAGLAGRSSAERRTQDYISERRIERQAGAESDPKLQELTYAIQRLTNELAEAKRGSLTGQTAQTVRIEAQLQATRQQYDAAMTSITASTK